MRLFELDNGIVFSTIYGGNTYFKSAISIHIPHILPRFWTFCVHFVSDVQVLVCLFQSAIRILHCTSLLFVISRQNSCYCFLRLQSFGMNHVFWQFPRQYKIQYPNDVLMYSEIRGSRDSNIILRDQIH